MAERPEDSADEARSRTSKRSDGDPGFAVRPGHVAGGATITVAGAAPVWPGVRDSLPAPAHVVVPRADLQDQLIEALRAPAGPVVGVTGDSGFGKTTLVATTCGDGRFAELFPDGVLWVSVGEDADDPELAARINALSARSSGTRPSCTGATDAVAHLGRLLGDRRCLVVLDDVWRSAQLEPFAGPHWRCRVLVITRFPATLAAAVPTVRVGAVRPDQARAVLTAGWPAHHPDQALPLLARLHAWPVLLTLAGSAVRDRCEVVALPDAVEQVADRITRGPEAVDRANRGQHAETAAAVVEMSLSLLDAEESQRCGELAVFPGDAFVPLDTVRTYWACTAVAAPEEVEAVLARLEALSLVQACWIGGARAIRVHDVVGEYLREASGSALPGHHRAFLRAFARKSPDTGVWELPDDDPYLRLHASHHRFESDRPRTGTPAATRPVVTFLPGRPGDEAGHQGWITVALVVLLLAAVVIAGSVWPGG